MTTCPLRETGKVTREEREKDSSFWMTGWKKTFHREERGVLSFMRKWEMMYCICSKVIDRREELFFPFHKNCAAEMKSLRFLSRCRTSQP